MYVEQHTTFDATNDTTHFTAKDYDISKKISALKAGQLIRRTTMLCSLRHNVVQLSWYCFVSFDFSRIHTSTHETTHDNAILHISLYQLSVKCLLVFFLIFDGEVMKYMRV